MQLSQESRRVWWLSLVATWAFVVGLLFAHTLAMRDYLTMAGSLGLRGSNQAPTPLRQTCMSFAVDAQTWIRHALALSEGHDLQLRSTTIDNAPDGREVHWNSAWAWLIVGSGRLRQSMTGEPLPTAVERASMWLNFAVFSTLIVLISAWAARRAGAIAGVVVAIGMLGSNRFYEGFYPGYVDHHGLLTTAVFGLMLGAVFMGAGWWRPNPEPGRALLPASVSAVRSAAVFSAVCGALGMWVSAASVVPPIAIVGGMALLVAVLNGRGARDGGANFDAEAWRIWGRVGAGLSLFFYLIEYAPSHLSLRLEANHPFYALAWLGGGELIAQGAERWLAGPGRRWGQPHKLVLPILAVAVVPVVMLIGGPAVFVMKDPFMAHLHQRIFEFIPLIQRIQLLGWHEFISLIDLPCLPLLFGLLLICCRPRGDQVPLQFAFLATLAFAIMGLWQTRWTLNLSGPLIALLLVALAVVLAGRRPAVRWILTMVVAGGLYLPFAIGRISGLRELVHARYVSPKEALQPLFRDVAAALRASQPTGEIVVLSSPNSSMSVGYYGEFKTLGTLYWENGDGLKAAAEIFSAHGESEAEVLLRAHRVTHIAMISEENFLEAYYELLHPGAKAGGVKDSFGYQLLGKRQIPSWLHVLPYRVPDDLKSLKITVLLFKVEFGQTVTQAFYNLALAQVAWGKPREAEASLDEVIKRAPGDAALWLRKAEVLESRGAWPEAAEAVRNGIERASAADRMRLAIEGAGGFYRSGQPGLAAGLYRAGLAQEFNPTAAANLAWILATSHDASLRNGPEALVLAEQTLRVDPDSPIYLNCMAAVLAENGRYPEAVETATRALTRLRGRGGNPASVNNLEQRLAAYRAGKPWRE
jgi:tetratricopeptide (TPR) repeat protein